MKIVAFFGTLSHLLAYGASLHGLAALVVHTDAREPERHEGRPYHYFDGRDPGRLYALLERAKGTETGLCVIDGAGNRSGLTASIAKAARRVPRYLDRPTPNPLQPQRPRVPSAPVLPAPPERYATAAPKSLPTSPLRLGRAPAGWWGLVLARRQNRRCRGAVDTSPFLGLEAAPHLAHTPRTAPFSLTGETPPSLFLLPSSFWSFCRSDAA